MPQLIAAPTVIKAVGNKPKIIREYVGRVNSKTNAASIAHMIVPATGKSQGKPQNLKNTR